MASFTMISRVRAPHSASDPTRGVAAPSIDSAWLAQRPYTAFFCEENAWQLACAPAISNRSQVVFITNATRSVAMWSQRAAAVDPIVWDYHVVVVVEEPPTPALAPVFMVLDHDCRSATVQPLERWLMTSFRAGLRDDVMPRFRVLPAAVFADHFASDRRHMIDHEGAPIKPFPPWAAPHAERGSSLERLLDLDDTTDDPLRGEVVDLPGLAKRFGITGLVLPPFVGVSR